MQESTSPAEISAVEAGAAVYGHEGTTATTEAAHGGEGGLPQLKFEYWGGQIVWLLILFAIFYVLVAKVFTPRMRKALDERSGTIADAVAAARNVQNEADAQAKAAEAELAEARARAQRIAAEAKAKVKAETAERQAAEEAKLNAKLAEAESRIRASRDEAMSHVQLIASDTASFLVEKLSGSQPGAAEVSSAMTLVKA